MEFVGKVVRKEFDGVGFCSGTVQSYDPPSGNYEIVYVNGVTETSKLSELAALLTGEEGESEVRVSYREEGRSRKRPGEMIRRHVARSQDEVTVMRNVDLNEGIPDWGSDGFGFGFGVGVRGNADSNCVPVETLAFDLNRAVVVPEPDEEDTSNKRRRLIDLNLDASFDLEDDAEVSDLNADKREEGWFDLNLAVNEENSSDDVLVQMNGDGEDQETNMQDDLETGGCEEVCVAEVSSGEILEELRENNGVSPQDLNGAEGDHDLPEREEGWFDLNVAVNEENSSDDELVQMNGDGQVQETNVQGENGVQDHLETGGCEEVHVAEVSSGEILEELWEENSVSPQELNAPDSDGAEGDHDLPEHVDTSLSDGDLNADKREEGWFDLNVAVNEENSDDDVLVQMNVNGEVQETNVSDDLEAGGCEEVHVAEVSSGEILEELREENSVSPQEHNAPDSDGAEGDHDLPEADANKTVDESLSDSDHDLPVSSTVTACLTDEVSPSPSVNCLTAEQNWIVENISLLPPKPQLPPSSPILNLDGLPVPYVFATYSFLRSFSTVLALSPFELKDFVDALRCTSPSLLFDSIHVAVLQILRKDLEKLADVDDQSATLCLRSLDWDMLDVVNYPLYIVVYLLFSGSKDGPGVDLTRFNFFRDEYFRLPMTLKIEILSCLCGDMIDAEVVRSELNKRSVDGSFDMNGEDCCICKMDGHLLCCDGCPATYHSKCVGVAFDLLPDVWYCPECSIDRRVPGLKPAKQIRGSQFIEIDPHGRKYYSSCGYLLVIDTDGSGSVNYYHANDVIHVLEQLQSCGSFYIGVTSAVKRHWNISGTATGPDILNMSFEGSAETAHNGLEVQNHHVPESSSILDVMKEPNMMNTRNEVGPNAQSESGYRNQYIFAQMATAISEEMARNSPGRTNDMRFDEEIASTEVKTILMKTNKFQWRSIQGLYLDAWKEKCGWCHSCKSKDAGSEKNCLFNMSLGALRGPSESEIANSQPIDNKSHLMAIIWQLLSMESRLQGLLVGPWLNPNHSRIWRERIMKASSISSLRHLLVEFEANLHQFVLSPQWLNHVDSAVEMGSSNHLLIASTPSSSKTTIGKRRGTSVELVNPTAKKNCGLTMSWWRGGRLSRQLFNWKVLPRSLVANAARQGGSVNIPGLMYPENSDPAKRSRRVAWEAAVESSTTSEQLGFQVRTLDSYIKWDDIENSHLLLASDEESKQSAWQFKKVIVRRKCIEEETVKYLLDFGRNRSIPQTRYIPDVVLKNGRMIEESTGERIKYWLNESYVPLHLLKGFEERKVVRKTRKPGSSFRHPEIEEVRKRSSHEKGFSYFFERAERSESSLCEQCKKDVPLSDAACCHICKRLFHKNHIRRADEEGMYICLPCKSEVLAEEQPIVRKRGPPSGSLPKKTGAQTQRRKVVIPARNSPQLKAGGISFRLKKHKKAVASKPGGSKKRNLETKRGSGRAKKARQENSIRDKRNQTCSSYWLNGLRLSRKPGDERVIKFLRDGCSKPLKNWDSVQVRRECHLCGSADSESGSTLIACETCEKWYHGDACGIDEKNSSMVIGFRCRICRELPSPSCPPM